MNRDISALPQSNSENLYILEFPFSRGSSMFVNTSEYVSFNDEDKYGQKSCSDFVQSFTFS